jgi:hypothetical protein
MFRLMQMRRLDPTELDFKFTSSAPWYSPTYSYLTFGSSSDPYQFCTAISKTDPQGGLALATTNARSMSLDGKALRKKGIVSITVDGAVHDVPDGPLAIGPGTGKRPHVTGPYNQIYYRPFLFVYPDGATPYADYASYLVSTWALVGNGHAGALPASKLTEAIAGAYNVVHLGRARADLTVASSMPFTWTDTGVASGTTVFAGASLLTVFDSGDRLGALLVAPKGKEYQLYWLNPFSSRSGLPDYFVWDDTGRRVAGYYSADWTFDAALGAGW